MLQTISEGVCMIWFGNLNRILPTEDPVSFGPLSERERMRRALEWVAERAPHLSAIPSRRSGGKSLDRSGLPRHD
jgi:hypothetical protein